MAAGVAALVASGGFGTPALRPFGIGLLAAGLGALALVELGARGLRVERTLDRERVRPGEVADVVVLARGWPVRTGLSAVLEWRLDAGSPPTARAESLRPTRVGDALRQEVRLHRLPRGEHRMPAPRLVVQDPLGLARRRRSGEAGGTLLGLAEVVDVTVPFWESGPLGQGGAAAGLLRGRMEIAGIRDYEQGDPLSLVHWGQTARRGHLQTKELRGERGRGADLVVVLDTRPLGDDAEAHERFELMVSAAASLLAACAARGDEVGLEHGGGAVIRPGTAWSAVEAELARVVPGGATGIGPALRAAAARRPAPRVIAAVTAHPDSGLALACREAAAHHVGVALVLVGPARAAADALRRGGAAVAEVGARADLAAALEGWRARATG
ncbi:MAG TPA: DUF58 domain-containing protein [Miltoncostaeaceae bacterium]|nr:DUF58 domain-containing protein [Miltoncostaeaceae bacterium]